MFKRLITGVVMFLIAIPIFIVSATWAMPAIASVLSVIAVYEMLHCIGLSGCYRLATPFYLYAAILPALTRLCFKHGNTIDVLTLSALITLFLILYLFAIMVLSRGKLEFVKIAEAFMTTVYITFGFLGMVFIHDVNSTVGIYAVILIFLAAFSTDIFAYICGRLFGKHPLIPEVSPKKTIEGSIGGTVFCILTLALYGVFLSYEMATPMVFPVLLVGGGVMSVVAQIGDLIMSVIKRTYGIKDYGKIFPGHGGVLDRFDSAIAVSVILLPIEVLFGLFK